MKVSDSPGQTKPSITKERVMTTSLTNLLSIRYPIIQGGMAWVADAQLAAAVSNAGGLGMISAYGLSGQELRAQIHACR
ncbi:MAG: hypothetical protein GXZ04_06105, partial [Clostridiales bacterium]|nr:hypothetical protein [Clostridiales bacterium]